VNREESLRAMGTLAASLATMWIGSKLEDDKMVVRCMRCGTEASFKLPPNLRGPADVPAGLDEELFSWRRAFQVAHEGCVEVIP